MFAKKLEEITFPVKQKAIYSLTNGINLSKSTTIHTSSLIFAGYCIISDYGKIFYAGKDKINFIPNEEIMIMLQALVHKVKPRIIYYTTEGDYYINCVLPEVTPLFFKKDVIQIGCEIINSYARRFAPAVYLSYYIPAIDTFIRTAIPFFTDTAIINKERFEEYEEHIKMKFLENKIHQILPIINQQHECTFTEWVNPLVVSLPKNVYKRIKTDADMKKKLSIKTKPDFANAIHSSYSYSFLASVGIEANLWSLDNYTAARTWQHKIFENVINQKEKLIENTQPA